MVWVAVQLLAAAADAVVSAFPLTTVPALLLASSLLPAAELALYPLLVPPLVQAEFPLPALVSLWETLMGKAPDFFSWLILSKTCERN